MIKQNKNYNTIKLHQKFNQNLAYGFPKIHNSNLRNDLNMGWVSSRNSYSICHIIIIYLDHIKSNSGNKSKY